MLALSPLSFILLVASSAGAQHSSFPARTQLIRGTLSEGVVSTATDGETTLISTTHDDLVQSEGLATMSGLVKDGVVRNPVSDDSTKSPLADDPEPPNTVESSSMLYNEEYSTHEDAMYLSNVSVDEDSASGESYSASSNEDEDTRLCKERTHTTKVDLLLESLRMTLVVMRARKSYEIVQAAAHMENAEQEMEWMSQPKYMPKMCRHLPPRHPPTLRCPWGGGEWLPSIKPSVSCHPHHGRRHRRHKDRIELDTPRPNALLASESTPRPYEPYVLDLRLSPAELMNVYTMLLGKVPLQVYSWWDKSQYQAEMGIVNGSWSDLGIFDQCARQWYLIVGDECSESVFGVFGVCVHVRVNNRELA